jgi:hypothetical protein
LQYVYLALVSVPHGLMRVRLIKIGRLVCALVPLSPCPLGPLAWHCRPGQMRVMSRRSESRGAAEPSKVVPIVPIAPTAPSTEGRASSALLDVIQAATLTIS